MTVPMRAEVRPGPPVQGEGRVASAAAEISMHVGSPEPAYRGQYGTNPDMSQVRAARPPWVFNCDKCRGLPHEMQ
jgi:hypothetical protein